MKGFAIPVRHGCRRIWIPAAVLLGLTALAVGAPGAGATVISGNTRTSLYVEESRLGAGRFETRAIYIGVDDTTRVPDSQRHPLQNRIRLGEELRLDVLQLGARPLAFHTSINAANILTDQSAKETTFRLYRAFFEWNKMRRGPGLGYDVSLGRHWVIAGVGTGTIDGVSAKVGDSRYGDVTVFGGTLGIDRFYRTANFWELDKTSQSRAFGGRVRLAHTLGPLEPQLAVSANQIDRKPRATLVTDVRRVGISAEIRPARTGSLKSLRGMRVWGELRRDLLWSDNLSIIGGLDYNGSWRGLEARVEYGQRRPELRGTSHFASFHQVPYNELRGGVGAEIVPKVRLNVDGDLTTSTDGADEKGLSVTAGAYGLTLGYRLHRGFGGKYDGLILYGHRDVWEKLTVDVSVGRNTYTYGDVPDEPTFDPKSRDNTSGLLALGYRLRPDLTLTGQVEGLQNGGLKRDVRFLGIVNWRFRTAF